MRSFSLIIVFASCIFYTKANAQDAYLKWVKQIGVGARSTSLAVSADNYVYIGGLFGGTVDFDPGTGVYNLTSGGAYDGFICKLDSSGNFIWAKQFIGTSTAAAQGISIVLDRNSNIYITGSWEAGDVDFNPGSGVNNLTPFGAHDIFICKLDSAGNFIWVKQLGGTSDDICNSITVDTLNNIITTGHFEGTADFDPSVGVYNLIAPGSIFVSKLDGSGNFVWAKKLGGGNLDFGYSVKTDKTGNVYSTGTFSGFGNIGDFDPGTATYNFVATSTTDGYISKLNSLGDFVWAKHLKGKRISSQAEPSSLYLDNNNDIYVTGDYADSVDFDPGVMDYFYTSTYLDAFILKLDPLGDFVWAKAIHGDQNVKSYSISVDTSGNIYTCGDFSGNTDFDPNSGIYTLTAPPIGNDNSFISKLDMLGNFIWVKQFVSTYSNVANSIIVDIKGNIYTTGRYSSPCDFDPTSGVYNLPGGGSFVHKMGVGTTGIEESNHSLNISVYPNPAMNQIVLINGKACTYNVKNTTGQYITEGVINSEKEIINTSNWLNGIYFLQIHDQNNSMQTIKLVKQ